MKRGDTYAVRYSIPKRFQAVVGRKEIVRSLGTTCLSEAIALRNGAIGEIEQELAARLELGDTSEARPSPKAEQTTIRATTHRWLSYADGINAKTRQRYQQHLEAFEAFAGNIEVAQIDRGLALRFMDHLKSTPSKRTGERLSLRALQSYQSCLASYWRVLDHWGLVDPDMRNPFSSLLRRVAGQRKVVDPRAKNLRPVTREEAESLLVYIAGNHRLKYQFEMFVTVRLLWVTGCRLNEIAGRSLEDIEDRGDHIVIRIPEAKTEAGKRLVMIVGEDDCRLVRNAIAKAGMSEPSCPDSRGLLFPRLELGGYDKRPSHYLGKALEKARKSLKDIDHSEWDMHSFRRSAVSALVNAGVATHARNLAVGHSNKEDIGVSVYAKRGDLEGVIKSTFEALYDEIGGSLTHTLSL
ncbi:DUF6538 domain-containing protein [Aliiroseovarius marinus]|uniref:DUF6538 domain-containing protein n=1 Tax=Aliiroseovarius marinus TaxID=2500159 RepID=UPI0031EDF9AC